MVEIPKHGLNKICSSDEYDSFPCGMGNGEMMAVSIICSLVAMAMAAYLTISVGNHRMTVEYHALMVNHSSAPSLEAMIA